MTPMSWVLLVAWALTSLGMFAFLVKLERDRMNSMMTSQSAPEPTGPPPEPMVPASLLQEVMAAYARLMETNQETTRSMMSEVASTVSALVSPPPGPSSQAITGQVRTETDPWDLYRSPAEQREAMEADLGAPAGWSTVAPNPAQAAWQSGKVGPTPPPNEMMGTGGIDPSAWDPSP
jgi:hypothetical protein